MSSVSASYASHSGSSHRAFSPLGTLPATEANEDLSEAVMFADMSKDGRQDGGREMGRFMVIFVVTHPSKKNLRGSWVAILSITTISYDNL